MNMKGRSKGLSGQIFRMMCLVVGTLWKIRANWREFRMRTKLSWRAEVTDSPGERS